MASRLARGTLPLAILLARLIMVNTACGAEENKSVELTVRLIQARAGTPVGSARIQLWTTDDLPGHGVHHPLFHEQQKTDEKGEAHFRIPRPSQKYLIFESDYDSCPPPTGIVLADVVAHGVVLGNTCANKKDKVHSQDVNASASELVILTVKSTRGHW